MLVNGIYTTPAETGGTFSQFLPTNLTSLASWILIDNEQGADLSVLTTLNDRAGAFTWTGGGNKPQLTYNSFGAKKGALFNTSKNLTGGTTQNAFTNNIAGITCHAIVKIVANNFNDRTIFSNTTGTTNPNVRRVQFKLVSNQVGFRGQRKDTDTPQLIVPGGGVGTFAIGDSFLYSCRVNYTTNTVTLYKNGTQVQQITNFQLGSSGNTSAANTVATYIGGSDGGFSESFQGDYLTEFILCTTASSDSEMTNIFNYFQKYYSLW